MDYVNALTMQGPLQKQSPAFLKLFQDRYFAIRGKGEYLVWFKKKPQSAEQTPQGIITLESIDQCVASSNDETVFFIQYLQRKFVLRAETEDLRDRWVKAINTIMEHLKKMNKNKKNIEKTEESWRWKNNIDKEKSETIRMENEQVILQEGDHENFKKSDAMLLEKMKGRSIIEADKCLIHGFHRKKGFITQNQRWFFIVSEFNLTDMNDQEHYKAQTKIIEVLNEEEKPKEGEKKEVNSSDEESEEEKEKEIIKFKINVIYELQEQTRTLKHYYPLESVVSWETQTDEQPYQLIIKYEVVVNEEDEEIQQKQLILRNQFLTEIKRWDSALRIIYEKYGIAKERQAIINKRAKRFTAKKWKYLDEQQWSVPIQDKKLVILVNKKLIKVNNLSLMLEDIDQNKPDTIKIGQDKVQVYYIVSKQIKVYIMFENDEVLKKFQKRLNRNKAKVQAEKKAPIQKQIKFEEKKIDHHTYYIDKKVRETENSIKVSFYDRMEGDVLPEKKEIDPNQKKEEGFWAMITGMFCGRGSSHDTV